MKIVPGEFSNSAWDCFIFAKEIAYKNHQQNVDSDNLLLALIKKDNVTKKILETNNVNIIFPDFKYCTDNAAMIAMAGYIKYKKGIISNLDITPYSSIKN